VISPATPSRRSSGVPERRSLTVALAVAIACFGVAAEVASEAPDGLVLAGVDLGVGLLLLAFGTVARLRRGESRAGGWMGATGAAWFAGTLGWPLVALHRAPLVMLHLSYPSGRLPRPWLARIALAAALVVAVVPPLARNDRLTVGIAALVAAAAVRVFLDSGGVDRKAAAPGLGAAVAFAGILSLGAALRLAGVEAQRPVLWAYDLVIAALVAVLLVDLLRARWSEAVLRGLVVDLGALRGSATLQPRLARALGDPRLVVGVWDGESGVYREESGALVSPPAEGSGLVATRIDDGSEPLALLVHDDVATADRELLAAVAALARTAVANSSLEVRVAEQAGEIAASRRRLIEAGDAERRALQRLLADGPEQRLRRVSELVAATKGSGEIWRLLQQELDSAIEELHQLADGVRPAMLEQGLAGALRALADGSPLEVSASIEVGRLPDAIEAAAYFVCAEALANAAKHADTTSARVLAASRDGSLVLEVADHGVGGADAGGSGLRGLADRVEALGGRFAVESAPDVGTRVVVEIPESVP
jgi:signal transduction histidine kinase